MRLSEENARLKRLAGLDGDGPEADRRNRAAPDGASDGPLAPGASPASPAGVRDRFASFKARCADARGRHPDFDAAVFDPQAPIAPVLAEALLEADDGPELAYFLAKNPADAVRLGRLSPPQAAIELGRIVARWGRPPARKTTNAPAPVSTLGGASASADKDPGRMPMAEYRRWRGFS